MYITLFVHWVYIPADKRQYEKSTLCKYPPLIYVFGFWCSPARKLWNTWHAIPFLFPIKYGKDFTGKVSWPQCSKFYCTTASIFSITSVLGVYWAEAFRNIDHAEGLIHFWCVWLQISYGLQANFLNQLRSDRQLHWSVASFLPINRSSCLVLGTIYSLCIFKFIFYPLYPINPKLVCPSK